MPVTCPRCNKTFKSIFGSHVWKCDVTPEEVFWAKVDKAAGADACWPFKGFLNHDGYGRVGEVPGHPNGARAHRYAWEIANGQPVPEGRQVLHRCDNPPCCNPAHLRLGSIQDNTADKIAKRRQTYGQKNRAAILTEPVVLQIRAEYTGAYGEQRVLAKKYGVDPGVIQAVVTRRSWKHLP